MLDSSWLKETWIIFEDIEWSPLISLILMKSADPKSRWIIDLLSSLIFHLQINWSEWMLTARKDSSELLCCLGFLLLLGIPSMDSNHLIFLISILLKHSICWSRPGCLTHTILNVYIHSRQGWNSCVLPMWSDLMDSKRSACSCSWTMPWDQFNQMRMSRQELESWCATSLMQRAYCGSLGRD